jgi:hypothetical protein
MFSLPRWVRLFRFQFARSTRYVRRRQPSVRPRFEILEDRTVPTTLTVNASDTATLISDITLANASSSTSNPYVIDLTTSTYSFTAANNTTGGANVLPILTAVNLTVVGNGSTLNAGSQGRLFDVAGGGSLILANLTLTGGLAEGTGAAAEGGAIYNSGELTVNSVMVNSNVVQGSNGVTGSGSINPTNGANAFGGGVFVSGGSVTLTNDTFTANHADGGNGGDSGYSNSTPAGNGASGSGGAVEVDGGVVTLNSDDFQDNKAVGGSSGRGYYHTLGGNALGAFGGAVNVTGGVVTLSDDTLDGNEAAGGIGGNGGMGGGRGHKGLDGFNGAVSGGGAVAVSGGIVMLGDDAVSDNEALGGNGGVGGTGLGGHPIDGGPGSDGGVGGNASGGGVYVAAGSVTLSNGTTLGSNQAVGGQGGAGGPGGNGGTTDYAFVPGTGGNGGTGGVASGGGLYVASGFVVLGDFSSIIADNSVSAGAGGAAGPAGWNDPNLGGSPGLPGTASFPDLAANSSGLGTYSVDVVTSTVTPLPANETPAFVVNWSGSDAAGLGLTYSVFVSKNGGTFQPWVTDSATTSAVFTGTVGAKYSFYSVATNSLGLAEATPTAAEATTTIVQNPASNLSKSTVQVASTVTAGETTTVTLHVAQVNGSPATSGGLAVKFALGSTAGGKGTFSAVTDNGNGTYSAVFTGALAGSNTIVATLNGAKVTSKAPTITVAVGALDLSHSPVTTSAKTVVAGGKITVTFQPEDAGGNKLKLPSLSVTFGRGAGAAQGTFTPAKYNPATGTSTATFTTTAMGSTSITATVGGVAVTSPAPALTVTPAATTLQKSVVTLSSKTVQSENQIQVTLQVVNANGQNATSGGLSVVFSLGSTSGAKGMFSSVTDNGNGTYSATFTGTLTGTNTIVTTIEGVKLTSKAPTITVTDGPLDLATSPVTLSAPTIKAGGVVTVTCQPKDAAGNPLLLGATTLPVFSLASGSGTFKTYTYNSKTGAFTAQFTATAAGRYTIETTYASQPVTSTTPTLSVTPSAVSNTVSTINISQNSVHVGTPVTVTFQAEDAYGNDETGNLAVTFALGSGAGTFGKVTSEGNGEYEVSFIPTKTGTDILGTIVSGIKIKSTASLQVTT